MITKEINENRKLISAFMGYEFADIGYFDDEDETEWQRKNQDWMKQNDLEDIGEYFVNIKENKWHEFDDAIYHLSFDWLMPVVEKIEKMDYGFKMRRKVVEVYIDSTKEVILKTKESCRMESLFKAVVEFINWYNDNKK